MIKICVCHLRDMKTPSSSSMATIITKHYDREWRHRKNCRPALPKDLFKNRFTWFCHEITRNFMCWLLLGFSLVMGLFMIKTGVDSRDYFCTVLPWVAFISAAFCLDSIHSSTLFWIAHLKSHYQFSSKLAQQVLEMNPGSDIEKWDSISSRLNDYFYRNNDWNTPYFFFDGKDAQDLFTGNVLKSYLDGNLESTTSGNEIESARTYLQSLHEEFESELKEPLPQPSPKPELARQSKGNENAFFRIFKYLTYWFYGASVFLVCLQFLFFPHRMAHLGCV